MSTFSNRALRLAVFAALTAGALVLARPLALFLIFCVFPYVLGPPYKAEKNRRAAGPQSISGSDGHDGSVPRSRARFTSSNDPGRYPDSRFRQRPPTLVNRGSFSHGDGRLLENTAVPRDLAKHAK
jgi:hypothetical protein